MVQRKVLEKCTDSELESYLKEGNRLTPEAVQMAFEILERRGRIFREEETQSVQRMIREKTEAESVSRNAEKEIWKDYLTDDPDAVPLYPRNLIMIIGFFLGTVPGAVLLGMNLIRLKKYVPAILTFIAGFAFIPLQNAAVPFLYDGHSGKIILFKKSPEFFISAVGAIILMVLWVVYTPKKLPYRTASYLLPIIISCIMLYLIVVNDHHLFSYNMINSLIRSYRELFTES